MVSCELNLQLPCGDKYNFLVEVEYFNIQIYHFWTKGNVLVGSFQKCDINQEKVILVKFILTQFLR